MIRVVDHPNPEFLTDFEMFFLSHNQSLINEKRDGNSISQKFLKNIPQFETTDTEVLKIFLSNFTADDGWEFYTEGNYVFKFEPDKPTMLPHLDFTPEIAKTIKSYVKRIIIYANPVWDSEWQGGTFFSDFENYKATRYNIPNVRREIFEKEATLVENKPARMVIMDTDEWHMPQHFSGNTVDRIIFASYMIKKGTTQEQIEKIVNL